MRAATRAESPPRTGLIVVISGVAAGGSRVVLHPNGLTVLDEHEPPGIALAGTHRAREETVSWAWGHIPAAGKTPQVWFESRTGLRCVPAVTRRLTSRVWAAQATGSWPRVRVQ